VARDQDHLSEHGRVRTKRRADLRSPAERELIRDFEPAEGRTMVIELTRVDFPVEAPGSVFEDGV